MVAVAPNFGPAARGTQASGGPDSLGSNSRFFCVSGYDLMAKAEKYVYSFGPDGTDGDAVDAGPVGRQGGQPGRNDQPGLARARPASPSAPTSAPTYYDHERSYPPELRKPVDQALAKVEKEMGAKFGSTDQSAAALLPLGRPRLDARHDGHGAQHRPERQNGRSPGQAVGQRAVCLGQLSPLRADVWRRRAGHEAQDQARSTIRSRNCWKPRSTPPASSWTTS